MDLHSNTKLSFRLRMGEGSLPLKKRRLLHSILPGDEEAEASSPSPSLTTSIVTEGKRSDERMAALALVASAVSLQPSLELSASILPISPTRTNYLFSPSRAGCEENAPVTPTNPKRMSHPLLANPLPDGCHGLTSRNNSYCRRQPCYNGSKYCKLHYQHYVLSGIRSPLTEEPTAPVSLPSSFTSLEGAPVLPTMHQDKRFTGTEEDEVRCLATTTRGRACSYIAVHSSKYCYLHADYDTNPPPRRGGSSQRVADNLIKETGNVHAVVRSESVSPVPTGAGKSAYEESPPRSPLPSSNSSNEVLIVETPGETKSVKRLSSWKHSTSDSPYPLLSTVSTDQWFQKRVIVSTGSLLNRAGRVEKWGNGWVSVRIAGVGVHNRRSFELFLHPNQEKEEDEEVQESCEDDTSLLQRCVSRDMSEMSRESNLETPTDGSSDEMKEVVSYGRDTANADMPGIPAETKQLSIAIALTDVSADEDSSKRLKMSLDTNDTKVGMLEKPSAIVDDAAPSATASKGLQGEKEDSEKQICTILPIVSPRTPPRPRNTKTDDGLTLVQTLLLAQEGHRHSNFDRLFGTAALDRSRRTVVKPERFEVSPRTMRGFYSQDSNRHSPGEKG
jgi:hypothetical protein